MTTLNLAARKPFNFHSAVNSHGWCQLAPCRFENDVLTYVDHLSTKRAVEYHIFGTSDGVQVKTDKLNKAEQKEVAEKVTWMLGLDMDFSDFYAASRAEPNWLTPKSSLSAASFVPLLCSRMCSRRSSRLIHYGLPPK